jgi:exopolysaccharide production protein ExoY
MTSERVRTGSASASLRNHALAPTDGKRVGAAAKRGLDLSLALLALLILTPLLVALCILVRSSDRGPALFRQTRVGRGGKRFTCYKFRSMVMNAEGVLADHLRSHPEAAREWQETQKLTNDPRITPVGQFLRKTSLDELPQLFNIIAGDMSLVGPRPIVPAECARYGEQLQYYFAVRPGLTGLWQVSGRSDCSYAERVALDVAYAREWSFSRDVVIIVRTVPAVLAQRGSR